MPKHDYIFVDESGDAGYKLDPITGELLSSNYYVAAALHLTDDAFRDLNRHVVAFRYYTGFIKELKIPPRKLQFERLLGPISMLAQEGKRIWASVVYVDKLRYTGPYLKPEGRRRVNPVMFRNFILRLLLEHHLLAHPLQTRQYDLVLDRVDLTKMQADELWHYIRGNLTVPSPDHITHASSIYIEGLQVVHHIAEGFKNIFKSNGIPPELSFVNPRNLTENQRVNHKMNKQCDQTGLHVSGAPPGHTITLNRDHFYIPILSSPCQLS